MSRFVVPEPMTLTCLTCHRCEVSFPLGSHEATALVRIFDAQHRHALRRLFRRCKATR